MNAIYRPGFNRTKLKKFVRKNDDLHAACLSIDEDIRELSKELRDYQYRLNEAVEKLGLDHNREIFNARREGREPVKHANFLDYPVNEMLSAYQSGHPIRAHLAPGTLETYVRIKTEIEELRAHQEAIQVELRPRRALVERCKEFLKNAGLTPAEAGFESWH